MSEKPFSWPDYRQYGSGLDSMMAVAAWGVFGGVGIPVMAKHAPDYLGAFVLVFLGVLAAFFAGPAFIFGLMNFCIRAAWENDEIGGYLEPAEARALIAAAPAGFVLHYHHLFRGTVHFGTIQIGGGWSSFVLEETATGRRWAVRFPENKRPLETEDIWKLAGARIELKRSEQR